MQVWQIIPTSDGHFRWSISAVDASPDLSSKTQALAATADSSFSFPSLADLANQAKVIQKEASFIPVRNDLKPLKDADGKTENIPVVDKTSSTKLFSIGKATNVSGEEAEKGVATNRDFNEKKVDAFLKFESGSSTKWMESSSRKAPYNLIDEMNGVASDKMLDDRSVVGFAMFKTGPGKPFMPMRTSTKKAVSALGLNEQNEQYRSISTDGDMNEDFPTFCTGLGKSVTVRQSSIRKAACLLDEDSSKKEFLWPSHSSNNSNVPLFQTGSGKSVLVKESSISRALSIFQEGDSKQSDKKCNLSGNQLNTFADSLFQTSSGKTVNISSAGLSRAAALLGLEGDDEIKPSRYLKHTEIQLDRTVKHNGTGGSMHNAAYNSDSKCEQLEDHTYRNTAQNLSGSMARTSNFDKTSYKFQTAGGKSLSISSDALNRARSLLGEADQSTVLVEDEKIADVASWNKENNFSSCLLHNASSKLGFNDHIDNDVELPEHFKSVVPLVNISNNIENIHYNMDEFPSKKRPKKRPTALPFKRPRNSRFTTPINAHSVFDSESTKLSTSDNCSKIMLFTRYPFELKRKTLKDYFGGPPAKDNLFRTLPDAVKHMNPDNAEKFRFTDTLSSEGIGSEKFYDMLIDAGALMTKEWLANHYKLIVWKLACLERGYQTKAGGRLLTDFNVFEELKYRYDREFYYGHRSALKKILDGDASPATMTVLCVSSIYPRSMLATNKLNDETVGIEENNKLISRATQIELTDGWYTLDANLDGPLSKQLIGGKIFVGQKLRIWGASLCGWSEPISPTENSKSVCFKLHMNGTYRAHWSDSLGFCKNPGAPLAFRCINDGGGKIPKTLVGITRIYPVLYRERYPDGVSTVRSEHMEIKMLQLYNQRRANIAEDIGTEHIDLSNSSDSEDGAKILKTLETSAEPEVIMADLSTEQLLSFTTYKSKLEDIRQSKAVKKFEKACEEAGISSRDVTPFMRVRVVGLTRRGSSRRTPPKEGMITIWNPTEIQRNDLVEGQIYSVPGLMPQNFGSDILYLQAKGSSTVWKPMILSEEFEPFYTPRKVVLLSNLGEVPLASEFDMAAVVVHVGESYTSGVQKKQWFFVTDGSKCSSEIEIEDVYDCLLAVSFSFPAEDDLSGLLGQNLPGTTIAFSNLVKRPRDQMNHLWVAEATELSTFTVCYNIHKDAHFKEAAASAKQWAQKSSLAIQKLRERVLCIVGDS